MKRFRIFSQDGTRWILLSALLALVAYFQSGIWLALLFIVVTALLVMFYYDPERELPSHPLAVMSPVDGVVTHINQFHDPFLGRSSQRIRIRADLLRVYQARSPTEGKLMEYWPSISEDKGGYRKTKMKGAWWIQTDEGDDVVMVVQSSNSFGRTFCRVQAGERIGQSRRCGRFPALCDVDILIGNQSFIKVEEGQAVQSGVDTIAMFNHDRDNTGQVSSQGGTYSDGKS